MSIRDVRRTVLTGLASGLVLFMAAGTTAVPMAGAATSRPGTCAAGTLPVPDNVAMAIVTAADPGGTVIFGRSYPDGSDTHQVLRWEEGKVSKVAFPGIDQAVNSVNAAGTGVGGSFSADGNTPTAYLYRNGKVTALPGGTGALAHSVNAGDVIVGEKGGRPVIWRSPTSAPVALAVPRGFAGGAAHAIDDDGTVVGVVSSVAKGDVAYAWGPDGSGRPLPPPGGEQGRFGAAAYTVRNGWATGIDFDRSGDDAGLRWDLRTNRVEAVPGMLVRPSTANGSGWLVGTDLAGHGVVFAGDVKAQLPDVFGHEPGTFSNLPVTISDDGRIIAGQADDADGTIHAVVWLCG